MRELLEQIEIWINNGQSVALATVIKTWGSSPRPVGAGMALTAEGEMAGSISGGCVEGAVIDASREVLKSGKTARLHFGVADSEAWEIGLACGGEIEVFIRIFDRSQLEVWKSAFQTDQVFCSALLVSGPEKLLGKELILVEDGNTLGADFPIEQKQSIVESEWPEKAFQKIQINQSTAIVMLTHDPKIDDPALKIALTSPAFYIGALGSKKTHKKRVDRLTAEGVESEKLNLVHAPIGLNLGGRLPEEIALSVIAEIVKVWNSAEN
jgi:xanthine dehydrogenase accessory factor